MYLHLSGPSHYHVTLVQWPVASELVFPFFATSSPYFILSIASGCDSVKAYVRSCHSSAQSPLKFSCHIQSGVLGPQSSLRTCALCPHGTLSDSVSSRSPPHSPCCSHSDFHTVPRACQETCLISDDYVSYARLSTSKFSLFSMISVACNSSVGPQWKMSFVCDLRTLLRNSINQTHLFFSVSQMTY